MIDVIDPTPLLEAAEQAAVAGNYAEAERLLREAAGIQEAKLGALHPDLASTLNNLALVCERTNKLEEAERGFRRARVIAIASLSPGHPFIATSLQNLADFCSAHGIPLWRPPVATPNDEAPLPEPETDTPPETVAPDAPSDAVPADAVTPDEMTPEAVLVGTRTRRWPARTVALVALGAAVLAAVALALQRRETAGTPAPTPHAQIAAPPPPVAIERPAPTTPKPVAPSNPPETPVQRPSPPVSPVTAASVTVLTSQLCSALDRKGSPDWQCARVTGDSRPGTYVFYTRVLTNVETTVEHRWYRGERVQQSRRLRVAASPGSGYRTFSSHTISTERAGDWRVELRGADGAVLNEARLVIR